MDGPAGRRARGDGRLRVRTANTLPPQPLRFEIKSKPPCADTPGSRCRRNCRKVQRRELAHMEPNTACDGWAEHWNLRVGPNYKKTGAKAPSAPQLYEFAGCENYVTADPCDNICSKIR